MADLTKEVALSHQKAPHQTGYSRHAPKRKLKKAQKALENVQSVAKFARILKHGPKNHHQG